MSAILAPEDTSAPPRPREPVRVLIACDHIDYDGAIHGGGRQLVELARALEARDDVVATVCVLRRASPLGRALQQEGLPFVFFGDPRFSPRSLGRLVRLVRERRIQVLHLTDFGASTLGRLAGRLTGTPSVVQVISHHSEHQARAFPWYVELAYRACAPLTAHALAISASVRDFAVERMGFREGDVEVLHYPLPRHSFHVPTPEVVQALRRRLGIGEMDPVVGAVTRFFASKGIRYLVEAFPEVLRAHPTAWLILVGQGPEEAMLRQRAAALGVAERVMFAGFQRDAHAWARLFDVAVSPSLEEGFGLVALEAQALGVPVVATRVGGLPEIVLDGETGLLVDAADPAGTAAAIVRLLDDPALRRRLGDAGARGARRFSLDRYVDRLAEIYREQAAAAGRRRR